MYSKLWGCMSAASTVLVSLDLSLFLVRSIRGGEPRSGRRTAAEFQQNLMNLPLQLSTDSVGIYISLWVKRISEWPGESDAFDAAHSIEHSPLDAGIEARHSDRAVGIVAGDVHLPNGLRSGRLGDFKGVTIGTADGCQVVFDIGIREDSGTSCEAVVERHGQNLMEDK